MRTIHLRAVHVGSWGAVRCHLNLGLIEAPQHRCRSRTDTALKVASSTVEPSISPSAAFRSVSSRLRVSAQAAIFVLFPLRSAS